MLPQFLSFSFILCSSLLFVSDISAHLGEYHHDKLVVCYVGTWAHYRLGNGKFEVHHIVPSLCTHLVYAFASLNETTNSIKPHDLHYDINLKGYQDYVALKEKNPKLKVLIAIGGWEEGATKYSFMADGKKNRTAFIQSVVEFLNLHKFDGLDLDWEYPAAAERGGRPIDKENFAELVKELKEEFQSRGWLLTAALGASPKVIREAYDIPTLSKYLDILNIMCYDYHGSWDKQAGHNAPLYPRPDESHPDQTLNLNATVSLLVSLGVQRQKVALGVPLYGRSFTLLNNAQTKPGSPTSTGVGMPGPYSNQSGFMGYNEFCEMKLQDKWTVVRDEFQRVPYAYKDNTWFSFDDAESLQEKVKFALQQGLGGIMTWSLETDDFLNNCRTGRFPLLKAINEALEHHDDINIITDNSIDTSTKKNNSMRLKINIDYLIIFILLSIIFV